jgi:hypothetical protein
MNIKFIIAGIVSIIFMGCCGTRYVQNERIEQIKPDKIEAVFPSNQIVGKIDTVTLATVYEASTVTPKGDSVKVKIKMKPKPILADTIWHDIDSLYVDITPHWIGDLDTNFTPVKPDTVIVKQVPVIGYIAFGIVTLALIVIIIVVWKFGKIKIGT